MALPTLKSKLATLRTTRVQMLDSKAGATPRRRGRAWMEARERIQVQQGSTCVDCGLTWFPWRDQVDHDIPLEQGGADEDHNLRLRCNECHAAKTKREAQGRARHQRG